MIGPAFASATDGDINVLEPLTAAAQWMKASDVAPGEYVSKQARQPYVPAWAPSEKVALDLTRSASRFG